MLHPWQDSYEKEILLDGTPANLLRGPVIFLIISKLEEH